MTIVVALLFLCVGILIGRYFVGRVTLETLIIVIILVLTVIALMQMFPDARSLTER